MGIDAAMVSHTVEEEMVEQDECDCLNMGAILS